MNYESFFSELEMFGIKLGLEQTRELFKLIGNPDRKLRFIHIAGTNGKGSVSAMLSYAMSAVGFKTGLYTSPHLVSVRERFRINGKAISEKDLVELIEEIKPAIATMKAAGASPTYFEITTALAAAYFAKNQVDFVIWETGLGGRFDATNFVTPEVSVITSIGLDHTYYLGPTLADIAFEKAGIIKEKIPVFCGPLPQEAEQVIRGKAAKLGSGLHLTGNISGSFKVRNQALATDVLHYLAERFSFSETQAVAGMQKVRWPGRFQITGDGSIIDGAHNPQAAESLVCLLKSTFPNEKFTVLFGAFADKDAGNTLKMLAPVAEEFIFAQVTTTRKTCSPDQLEKTVREFSDVPIRKVDTAKAGLKLPRQARLLITGSLYLVGEVIKEFVPESEILDLF